MLGIEPIISTHSTTGWHLLFFFFLKIRPQAGGAAQVVEHLRGKREALSSHTHMKKQNKIGSHYVAQGGLKFMILLLQPLEC
jgi:hypothetical protein